MVKPDRVTAWEKVAVEMLKTRLEPLPLTVSAPAGREQPWTDEPPEHGRANDAVLRLVADALSVER